MKHNIGIERGRKQKSGIKNAYDLQDLVDILWPQWQWNYNKLQEIEQI